MGDFEGSDGRGGMGRRDRDEFEISGGEGRRGGDGGERELRERVRERLDRLDERLDGLEERVDRLGEGGRRA